ncbi:YiiX/YebB-like N1pC/P60 family cysteine hydrolase [Schlesneria paludicola]|uniref:YiiX/YebB-like N1pC/P60 family cysteine hydrolase n=1 Tax=Schlesneria paludicola TaxID=360056 RepID=UPI0009FD3065|nr:YiiX/YebB-like N1pC/P60 family cysteine hydrolase [Schlesneria paludicola]
MWSVFIACTLTCSGANADPETPPPPGPVMAAVNQTAQTGTLIFSRGDCLAVKVFSQSSYTHVGGVVVRDGQAIVYDSMNGQGVRKTPLAEYLRQQTPSTVHLVHPKTPLTQEQATAYETHLESQLGRKYAVKHHLTGRRCEGLHCAEYMTDALMAASMMTAKQPPRVSPGSLLEGVLTADVYVDGTRMELKLESPPQPEGLSWYQRAWRSTSTCCTGSATQMRRWILCR